MWSSILVVALLFALNPGVLGVIVLLISRPRPVQNLLAFWLGSAVVSVPLVLVPLIMLHVAPESMTFAHDLATPSSPTARHVQIGMGIVTLFIAAVMTTRYLLRRSAASPETGSGRPSGRHRVLRGRGRAATSGGDTTTLVLEPDTSTDTSAPDRTKDPQPEGGSVFRRLIRRAYAAWEKGSVWIAFVFGMTLFPGPPLALFVVTTIASSGYSFGTKIVAAVAFVLTMLGLVEIILVSHVVAPTRTQVLLGPVHVWARAHRQVVVISILTIIGTWQVIRGAGIG